MHTSIQAESDEDEAERTLKLDLFLGSRERKVLHTNLSVIGRGIRYLTGLCYVHVYVFMFLCINQKHFFTEYSHYRSVW